MEELAWAEQHRPPEEVNTGSAPGASKHGPAHICRLFFCMHFYVLICIKVICIYDRVSLRCTVY